MHRRPAQHDPDSRGGAIQVANSQCLLVRCPTNDEDDNILWPGTNTDRELRKGQEREQEAALLAGEHHPDPINSSGRAVPPAVPVPEASLAAACLPAL